MKKITTYLSIIAAGALLLASCSLNDTPEFNDAEAFVAFDKVSISVAEDTTVASALLRVPVRLTSLGGLTSTVTFQFFDGHADRGALDGRDYEFAGGNSVLTFSADAPVQYIEIDILSHAGVFTGDRSFGIKLTGSGSVKMGAADSVAITILDLDHPLAFILGNYVATGTSNYNGPSQWATELAKDSADVTKVWISDIAYAWGEPVPVYGIVNEEKDAIRIPVGQVPDLYGPTTYDIALVGYYGPEGDDRIPDGGFITATIAPDGTITVLDYFGGLASYKSNGQIAGWIDLFLPGVVFSKQ